MTQSPAPATARTTAGNSRAAGLPGLDIVIVNWNAGALLSDCISSMAGIEQKAFRIGQVVVVDNASTDGSADRLDGLAGGNIPLEVVHNSANRGFAAACNQGAARGTGDWILFLNPDTRLFADSLDRAMAFASADPTIGALGIALVDATGERQRSCARTPTPVRLVAQSIGLDRLLPGVFPPHFMTGWDHADTRDVDQVMGAFLMIPRPLFERLGGFDERYFVYFDDVDLCLCVRQAGYRVVHYAGATAFHQGCGTTDGVRDRRLFYSLRSRLLFTAKHYGPLARLAVSMATLIAEPLSRLAQAVLRRSPADAGAVLRGTGMLWRDLPGILPVLFRSR